MQQNFVDFNKYHFNLVQLNQLLINTCYDTSLIKDVENDITKMILLFQSNNLKKSLRNVSMISSTLKNVTYYTFIK